MKKKTSIFFYLYLFCMLTLGIRLYNICFNNPAKEVLSGQYTRKFTAASKNGAIYDRNLSPLSFDNKEYITVINPSLLEASVSKTAETLQELGTAYDYLQIKKSLESKEVFTLITRSGISVKWAKSFPFYRQDNTEFLRHIIGYNGASKDGIYKYYSDILNQMSGKLTVSYTSDGINNIINGTSFTIYDNGYTQDDGIILTVDKGIQSICEDAADNNLGAGAILVCDSQNGDILACVSRPVYDLQNINSYLNSKDGEFINRAFCSFPAGSVFKIVTAAAALENDLSLFNLEYECCGSINAGNNIISCHKKEGHGKITMLDAFAHSCNTYFINLANLVGLDMLTEMAQRLGISSVLSIDRFDVQSGLLPDDLYSSPALIANTAIGQGDILISPVEAANLVNAACTGKICSFSLVKGYKKNGEIYFNPTKKSKEVLDKSITELICKAMSHCVNFGTGNKAYVFGAQVGGKTGTAQTGMFDRFGKEINHHWFVGAFPIDNPKYTVVVFFDGKTSKKNIGVPQQIFAEICKKLKNKIQN